MKDYKHTADGDLDMSFGDLQITESLSQHQRDLLLSDKGHIRDRPDIGVGAINYMIDQDPEDLLRTTRQEFTKDGMKVKRIGFNRHINDLEVEAYYEKG